MKFLQTQVRSKLDKSLHEKLITIEASLPEIEKQLSEIDISRDQKAYAEMAKKHSCLLYTSPSPRDVSRSRMPSSA